MDPPPFSQQFFEWEDSGKLHYETWERPGTIATALTFFFFHGICESAETLAVQVAWSGGTWFFGVCVKSQVRTHTHAAVSSERHATWRCQVRGHHLVHNPCISRRHRHSHEQ